MILRLKPRTLLRLMIFLCFRLVGNALEKIFVLFVI